MTETEPDSPGGVAWSGAEVAATVDDYVSMLRAELRGQEYSKTEHRMALLKRLFPGRTQAAVEFKHSNVSAVMVELGLPYIKGYRPRGNYQEALADEIRSRLAHGSLLTALEMAEIKAAPQPLALNPDAPPQGIRRARKREGRTIDYEALQSENRRLGTLGEELVVEHERAMHTACGRTDLAAAVRWVSIPVKTTTRSG